MASDLEAEVRRRLYRAGIVRSCERILTHPDGFGLVTATPVQRAICRVLDGTDLGELWGSEQVRAAFGDARPTSRPRELVVRAGIRGAKTMISAAAAIVASQTVDVSGLAPGEIARVPIVSLTRDNAAVAYGHLVGQLTSKPLLKGLVMDRRSEDLDELAGGFAKSVFLRHPTGVPIQIAVVAGAKAGGSLVSRWVASCIFDEAPRMVGASEGAVNLEDARTAILGRLLPGAVIIYPGSPWAPMGPFYEWDQEGWGRPSGKRVVVRARADWLNPAWWTPERMDEVRQADPRAYRTDVEAEYGEPEESMFSAAMVDACTRAEAVLAPDPLAAYVATIDPATRRNAWTLVVTTRDGEVRRVALAAEWRGTPGAHLDPEVVLGEIAALVRPYRVAALHTDQWAADVLRVVARRHGLALFDHAVTSADNVENFGSLAQRMAMRQIEIPRHAEMRADLIGVKRRLTSTGVQVQLPRTADGRHGDFAAVLALAVSRHVRDVTPAPADVTTREAERMRAAVLSRVRGGQRRDGGHWLEDDG